MDGEAPGSLPPEDPALSNIPLSRTASHVSRHTKLLMFWPHLIGQYSHTALSNPNQQTSPLAEATLFSLPYNPTYTSFPSGAGRREDRPLLRLHYSPFPTTLRIPRFLLERAGGKTAPLAATTLFSLPYNPTYTSFPSGAGRREDRPLAAATLFSLPYNPTYTSFPSGAGRREDRPPCCDYTILPSLQPYVYLVSFWSGQEGRPPPCCGYIILPSLQPYVYLVSFWSGWERLSSAIQENLLTQLDLPHGLLMPEVNVTTTLHTPCRNALLS